jgi:hypothetical protein
MRHRLRRADAGHWLPRLERSPAAAGAPWHYVANQLPTAVPAGAHVIERWQANWDGGPGLLTRIAVVDHPLPDTWSPALIEAAERTVTEARVSLAAFGHASITTCTWLDGELDRAGQLVSALPDDVLGAAMAIIAELHTGAVDGQAPRLVAAGLGWRALAASGHRFPDQLEDLYGTFGPGGPPVVPADWRGRAVADVTSPFEPLTTLCEAGVVVLALGRDEAVLHRR